MAKQYNILDYLLYVQLKTGLRFGEVLGLTWDCVLHDSQEIYTYRRYDPRKQEWRPPRMPSDFVPDASSVEQLAKQFDPRAKQTPRGWYFRCVKHEDRQASAVLFNSGWYFCSGCGYKELMVKKENI